MGSTDRTPRHSSGKQANSSTNHPRHAAVEPHREVRSADTQHAADRWLNEWPSVDEDRPGGAR